jgi:hypothetical protein
MTNKDIIKQYVDTGLPIPEYQFNKLSPSLLKTYLRKRFLYIKDMWSYFNNRYSPTEYEPILYPYEYVKYDDVHKKEYDEIRNNVEGWKKLKAEDDRQVGWMDDESFDDIYEPIIQN